jgi:hypothetical protein
MKVCGEERSTLVLEVEMMYYSKSYSQPISDGSPSANFIHDHLETAQLKLSRD